MSFLVISTSLNPNSKSYLLAREAQRQLSVNQTVDFLDLRKCRLPQCNGSSSSAKPNVGRARRKIEQATCILVAVPIYNYDCGSAAKNLIELSGDAWKEKTVGFLCAAGGQGSYMSIMGLANSLMLDFRCLIIPRFVYATGAAFADGKLVDASITGRVEELVQKAVLLNGVNVTTPKAQ